METVSGGPGWVIVVNLILWTGLFLYMLSLHAKVRRLERTAPPVAATPAAGLPAQERIEP